MSITEIIAVLFTLISIILTIKNSVWNWPVGIIGIVAYLFIFLQNHLYCEMILQIIFIFQSVYGWFNWGKIKNNLPITQIGNKNFCKHLIILAIISTLIILFLLIFIKSSQPFYDVLTTTFSLLATYYLTEKYLENWEIWIVADILFILMFIHQGLYLSAILYFVFLMLAGEGLLQWEKELKSKRT